MNRSHNNRTFPADKMLPLTVAHPVDGRELTDVQRKTIKKHHTRKSRRFNKKATCEDE